MQIGLCTTIDRADWVKSCGFDYIEIPMNSYAQLPAQDFQKLQQTLCDCQLSCPVGNFFYASDLRLTGPNVDFDAVTDYSKQALERAASLGVKLVVIGSGAQRRAPEGFNRGEAAVQFAKHVATAGELAVQYGIVVTVEAIRPASTNILNTLRECIALQKEIAHPNVKLMADFSQMRGAGEGMDSILLTTGDLLLHAHICNSHTTSCPMERDEDIYDDFFHNLKTIGYSGNLTVEVSSFERERLSSRLLRELIAEYKF